jgi:hypothetical protein
MCIAIYKPEGFELTEDSLINCWNANSDGAGFMYPEDGKINIIKGLMTYDEFRAAYDPHSERQLALHFRIATHGGVTKENTHPFQVSDTLGMIHNGIISKVDCDIDKSMSDTWHFTERYLKPMEYLWKAPEFKDLAESFIGFSKIVLLNGEGEHEIYNEAKGHWNSGVWFSNNSYDTPKTITSVPKPKWPYKKTHTPQGNVWDMAGDEDLIYDNKKYWKPSVGDTAWLRYAAPVEDPVFLGENMPKNTRVRIISFGQNNTVWVEHTYKNSFAQVPLWHLEEDSLSSERIALIDQRTNLFS